MEKISFNNSKGSKIVANLYNTGSDKVIIIAHGFMNYKSSNGRFEILSKILNKANYDSLAIDFSGCGESEDDEITSKNQVDDLSYAIEFALTKGYKKIALFGNSFGTLACLRSYRREIITIVLIGPIMEGMKYDWNEYFSKEQMKDLNYKGFFYSDTDRRHKITKQTLKDFENINQEELIEKINCPILIIHGNNIEDDEELQLLERSKKAINKLSHDSRLEIIDGGRHGLYDDWSKVIDSTIIWYDQLI